MSSAPLVVKIILRKYAKRVHSGSKPVIKPVPKETQNKAQKPLELVYSHILGPFEVPSLNGSRYTITFVDEYSKYSVVKFMSKKSEALEKFKEYVAESGSPRRLRTDNGAEYTARKFTDLL